MGETRLYTTQEVADQIGVTTGRIRQLAVPLHVGTKVGRDWVFTADDIERLRERDDRRRKAPAPDESERG